jgi:methylenetetrahydrofolate dehydrogenase (NADP+)/methenyltetrahydrofolate cyclohydrolase
MIVDGKRIANNIEEKLKKEFSQLPQKRVCFVMLGNDPASKKFIEMKSKVAERLGVAVDVANEMVSFDKYDGVVVQLPLPQGMDTQTLLDSVPVEKDIDVLGTEAKTGNKVAPVARAVLEILNYYKVDFTGKNVLVIGNGKLVGEPISHLFTQTKVSHDVIDINTPEQERVQKIQEADIIISGAGVPHMIKPSMIKQGVILIDAGTSEQMGKLAGDVDPLCVEKASLMTPVPGGVGPITVVSLFANLL